MIGADRWIYNSSWRFPYPGWWKETFRDIPKRVVIHRVERLIRGFSRYDMYNGGEFIADVISNTAYQMFLHTHSYPPGITYDEWLDTLLELREAFARDEDIDWVPADGAFDLLGKHFNDLWD